MRRMALATAFVLLAVWGASAQDATKGDPKEYKVEAENEQVRVVRVNRTPHSLAPMHEHSTPYVVIALTDVHQKITTSDGKSQESTRKAGQAAFASPVKHEELNLENKPAQLILVELKGKAGASKAAVPASLDPVKLDPRSYKVEVENDLVRVVRATRGAHSKVPMHAHPAYVTVYLTDVHQKTTDAEGKVTEVTRKAGEAAINKPIQHAEDNISDQPFEAVLVELK